MQDKINRLEVELAEARQSLRASARYVEYPSEEPGIILSIAEHAKLTEEAAMARSGVREFLLGALIALCVIFAARAAFAGQQDVLGPVNEGTTATFWVSFCDDAKAVTDSTNCPDGGALVTYSNISALTYVIQDKASNRGLPSATPTPASVTVSANPVKIVVPYGAQLIVGRCSNSASTYCTADGTCGLGNTCEVDKKTFTDGQLHVLTLTATLPSSVQVTERIPFLVRNLEYYP